MTSFEAHSGENVVRLDFILDEHGTPTKLGDGTFGCVFHVRDHVDRNYALKIFYESDDEFIKTSQNEETKIGDRLRRHYRDNINRASSVERYLVISQGSVTNFKESDAYKTLKKLL